MPLVIIFLLLLALGGLGGGYYGAGYYGYGTGGFLLLIVLALIFMGKRPNGP